MRAVETAKIGLFVSCVALVVNVSLNYVLIFGKLGFPALGVTGAAIATLISRIVESTVMVVYVRLIDRKLCLRFKDLLKNDRRLTRDFLRYGTPIVGGQIVWSCQHDGPDNDPRPLRRGRHRGDEHRRHAAQHDVYRDERLLERRRHSSRVKTVGAGRIDKNPRVFAQRRRSIFLGIGVLSGIAVFLLRDPFISMYNASPAAVEYSAPVHQRDLDHDRRHLLSGGLPVRPREVGRRHRVCL